METELLAILFSIPPADLREKLAEEARKREGRVLKTIGNAYVLGFASARAACTAALEFRKQLPSPSLWRAGLAHGEVTVSPRDVFGEPVNLAARLEGVASDGEILAADSIRLATEGHAVHLKDLGMRTFKGGSKQVRIFALEPTPAPARATLPPAEPAGSRGVPPPKAAPAAPSPPSSPAERLKLVAPAAAGPAPLGGRKRWLVGAGAVAALLLAAGWWATRGSKPPPVAAKSGAFGTLFVQTTPPGADVWVEEKRMPQQTPVEFTNVPANRKIRIRIRKPGFQEHAEVLKVSANESKRLAIALKPAPQKK